MSSDSFTHSVTYTPCTQAHVLGEVEFGETNEVLYVNSEVFSFAQKWLPENKGRTAYSGGPACSMLRLKTACPWVPRSLCKGQLIQSCWSGRWAFVGCPGSSPQNKDSEWTCLHHQAGTHCPGLGDSSGSRGYSHSHRPGHCLHRAPGEDLTGALLCTPLPQAAARPHSCRGRGTRTVPGTSRLQPLPNSQPRPLQASPFPAATGSPGGQSLSS